MAAASASIAAVVHWRYLPGGVWDQGTAQEMSLTHTRTQFGLPDGMDFACDEWRSFSEICRPVPGPRRSCAEYTRDDIGLETITPRADHAELQ